MLRKLSILLIVLSLIGGVSHAYGWALPSLRWFFEFGDVSGYVVMGLGFILGVALLVFGGKDIQWKPMTLRKFQRFKSIRRGYYALIIFSGLVMVAMLDQAVVGKRALVVNYQGEWYFPAFQQRQYAGVDFGQENESEANYRELKKSWKSKGSNNWVLMPPVPWDPVLDSQDLVHITVAKRDDGKYYREGESNPYSGLAYTHYRENPEQQHMMYKFRKGLKAGRSEGFSIDGDPVIREIWDKGVVSSRNALGDLSIEEFDKADVTPLTSVLYPALRPAFSPFRNLCIICCCSGFSL